MNNKGELLIRAFDEAARQWGWQTEHGTDNRAISRTMFRWRRLMKELLSYVKYVEEKLGEQANSIKFLEAERRRLEGVVANPLLGQSSVSGGSPADFKSGGGIGRD